MTESLKLKKPLPVGSIGTKTVGWWGVWTLIVTEASLFGYLLVSYFYLYLQQDQYWPPDGPPALLIPGINTVILLTSSLFVYLSERAIKRQKIRQSLPLMLIGIGLGAIFIAVQLSEWKKKTYGITSNQYGSLYFTITGLHMLHVAVGLLMLLVLMFWTWRGYFRGQRSTAISVGSLYWHFVDVVWLVIFSSLYFLPHLHAAL